MNLMDDVINTTLELVVKHGVTNINISLISEHARCSRRTIYRLFLNKENLYFQAYRKSIVELNKVVLKKRIANLTDDHFENCIIGMQAMLEAFVENTHFVKFIVEFDSFVFKDDSIRRQFSDTVTQMDYIVGLLEIARLKGVFDDSLNTDQIAFLIYDSFLGTVYRFENTFDSYDRKLQKESLYKIVNVYKNYLLSIKLI